MSVLTLTDLSHQFGEKILYEKASLRLNKQEHMGITGQNGVGKSTLIKMLTGELLPDEGEINWQKNVKLGYLDQYAEISSNVTIEEFLYQVYEKYVEMENEITELYAEFAVSGEDRLLEQAGKLQVLLEESDFYQAEVKIKDLALGLGITAIGLEKPIKRLSGGQRSKVILAKLLLEEPDVLLLDEPTNYLDTAHIQWLSDYLIQFDGSFLLVSHDYHFLNQVTNCICDIEFGKFTKYKGNVEQTFKQKESQKATYLNQYYAQQKKIRETEAFIQKYKAGIKSTMARGRQKQLDRLERLTPPGTELHPSIHFPYEPLTASQIVETKQLQVGYEQPLLNPIQFSVRSGEKVVVKGFNGIGKSTLIQTIVGKLPALSGCVQLAANAKIGYFCQELAWSNQNQTPLTYLSELFPTKATKDIRANLAKVGLPNKLALQPLHTLSGGEQTKVKLCELTMEKSNVLILDEPTNHIDQRTKEGLQEALKKYEGTILLVSHEVNFYQPIVNRVFNVEQMKR